MLGRLLNRGPLVAETTASELAREIHEGTSLQIVDVRELDEWHGGRIPGSIHIPLGQLGQRVGELDAQTRVVAVCRTGNRSTWATMTLQNSGFQDVVNLDGGIVAWARADLPIER